MAVPNPFRSKPAESADDIIMRYVKGAGALGAAGTIAMHADVFVLAGLWTIMIVALARHHKVPMGHSGALKIATALAAATGTFAVGFYAATAYFAWSVVGIPAVMAANVAMDAILTCAVGVIVSMVFASGNDGRPWVQKVLALFTVFLGKLGWELIKQWWKDGASPAALAKLLGFGSPLSDLPRLPPR